MPLETPLLLPVNVIITERNGKQVIELRRKTNDPDRIKEIVEAALSKDPYHIQPTFHNKLQSVESLQEKEILYRNEDNKLEFHDKFKP